MLIDRRLVRSKRESMRYPEIENPLVLIEMKVSSLKLLLLVDLAHTVYGKAS